MPSNDTLVCFKCRIGFKQTNICPSCGDAMTNIGHKISIPKKNNVRMWKRMEVNRRWNKKKIWRHEEFGPFNMGSWAQLPGYKKGQNRKYIPTGPRSQRPDMPGK